MHWGSCSGILYTIHANIYMYYTYTGVHMQYITLILGYTCIIWHMHWDTWAICYTCTGGPVPGVLFTVHENIYDVHVLHLHWGTYAIYNTYTGAHMHHITHALVHMQYVTHALGVLCWGTFYRTCKHILHLHWDTYAIYNTYYMALACGRYNVRFDWLIVTEL